jgi:hypothetical protein
MARELAQKSPSGRPKRQSLTQRGRMRVRNADPNFVYRFVNDTEDRVEILKEMGYEVVTEEAVGRLSDKRVDVGAPVGSGASIAVGNGTRAVLMRIPKTWYQEAQQEKLEEVTKLEESLKPKNSDGTYGKVEMSFGT